MPLSPEVFEQIKQLPANQNPVRQRAIIAAEGLLTRAGVEWLPPTKVDTLPTVPDFPSIETQSVTPEFDRALLDILVEEYREKPHTPELITKFNRGLWSCIGQITGVNVDIPDFTSSQKNIDENEKDSNTVIYLPDQFTGDEARPLLLQAFGLVDNQKILNAFRVKDQEDKTYAKDVIPHSGYMFVESTIEPPYKNTGAGLLKSKIKTAGREGMNMADYLVASLYSKILNGTYLDEAPHNSSRLLGCKTNNGLTFAVATFTPPGSLIVYWGTNNEQSGDYMGGRSIKKI